MREAKRSTAPVQRTREHFQQHQNLPKPLAVLNEPGAGKEDLFYQNALSDLSALCKHCGTRKGNGVFGTQPDSIGSAGRTSIYLTCVCLS